MQRRHRLGRKLDTQIAARDHRRIGELEDFLDPLHARRLFELDEQRRLAADQRPRLGDVLGALHERQRDPVDMLFEREGQVLAVLFGQRRERHDDVGDVDALAIRNPAADLDHCLDPARRDALHAQHQLAVVDQQARASLERGEQFGVRQVDTRRVARRLVGVEREGLAVHQFGRTVLEGTDAQLRSLQVDEDRRRAAGFLFERADRGNHLGMAGVVAVAHVDAKGVGARAVQFGDHLGIGAGGAKRRRDADLALAGVKFWTTNAPDRMKSWGRLRRRVAPAKASRV